MWKLEAPLRGAKPLGWRRHCFPMSPPRRVFRCRCQKRGAYIHDNVCATRVIVSKDEDFLYLASRAESAAPLLWVRLGNCRTSALIEAFDRLWPRIEQALVSGEGVVEVR